MSERAGRADRTGVRQPKAPLWGRERSLPGGYFGALTQHPAAQQRQPRRPAHPGAAAGPTRRRCGTRERFRGSRAEERGVVSVPASKLGGVWGFFKVSFMLIQQRGKTARRLLSTQSTGVFRESFQRAGAWPCHKRTESSAWSCSGTPCP